MTERQPSSGGGGDQPVQPAAPSYRRISPEELQQLKAQAGATRERTKELVARYLAAQESRMARIARGREVAVGCQVERDALNECVARYASLLRLLGEPPERTLVLIKGAFNEAAPVHDEVNRSTLDEVVAWIIAAYYAA